jgi:diguanylate cyclase
VTYQFDSLDAARLLIEENPVGVLICDLDGTILDTNEAFINYLGDSRERLLGLPVSELWPAEDADINMQVRKSVRTGAVPVFAHERRYVRRDGQIVHGLLHLRQIVDREGQTIFLAHIVDITARKTAEDELQRAHFVDRLTGLFSKQALLQSMDQSLGRGAQRAMIVAAVEGLRGFLEQVGPIGVDQVLCEVAHQLKLSYRDVDVIARVGEVQFGVYMDTPNSLAAGNDLRDMLCSLFQENGYSTLSASVGVRAPEEGDSGDRCLRDALVALHYASTSGTNTVVEFNNSLGVVAKRRNAVLRVLREALEHGDLAFHLQPCLDSTSRKLVGFEALARLHDAELGSISPVEFIPLAEEHGLVGKIGLAAVDCVGEILRTMPGIDGSFNLSPLQLNDADHIPILTAKVLSTNVDPARFKLEVTESVFVETGGPVRNNVRHLKIAGVSLWIDDFGTGYSSLTLLHNLPFDGLKIDRSFVNLLPSDSRAASLVKASVVLARELSLASIGEGVESLVQADMLRDIGCEQLQGYWCGRPVAVDEFMDRWRS